MIITQLLFFGGTLLLLAPAIITTEVAYAQLTGATGDLQQQQTQTTNNNSNSNSSSVLATTQSEILWESEVRERRELAGLPPENNSTLPNLTKSAESLEIDRLQAEDPAFANFETVLDTCYQNADSDPSNDVMPHAQCLSRLEEASAMWCGVETYDAKKCDYVSNQSTWYESMYTFFDILRSP